MDDSEDIKNSNFDIIDYPLKLNQAEEVPFFVKTDSDRYEFRILNTIDSKRICASKHKKNKDLFFHLRIENEECKIIGCTTDVFSFSNSCDFYLEQNESTRIYNSFTNKILSGSLNDIISSSTEFLDLIETNNLPEYTPLVLNSTLTDLINLKSKTTILPEQCVFKINYEDEVPEKCAEEYKKLVFKYLEDDFTLIKEFFESITAPVIRIMAIIRLLKEFNRVKNTNLLLDKVKKAIPLFRYFYVNGPWRKSWVLYGFNPKNDKMFYKYQIVDLRLSSVFYTLIDNEKVVKEVEEHEDWYLKDVCDVKHGYFKPTLEQLIMYSEYLDFNNTNEEETQFELFDI